MTDPTLDLFAEIARLKQEGVPYEERINLLDHITWPTPLAELLDACYATYRERHPWVEEAPTPKSILREVLESGETFGGFIHRYKLQRSEGLFLRYLTDAWRTLDRSLPDDLYTDAVEDVVDWLGALIRATDASLLDEWARLAGGPVHDHAEPLAPGPFGPPRAWRTAVRTAAFGWVELLARRAYPLLAERTGLETILGCFVAGAVVGTIDHDAQRAHPLFRVKLDAIGFGFVVPIFFVSAGIRFDLRALADDSSTLALVPVFLAALLVVRGLPAWLYRAHLATTREVVVAGLLQATSLPFIVTATMIGVEVGALSAGVAAAFVGAGLLSALIFPVVALMLAGRNGLVAARTAVA